MLLKKDDTMARSQNPQLLNLCYAVLVLFSGFVSGSAQKLPPHPAEVKSTAIHNSNRRLVRIKARAGDTLILLGDRFGVPALEIAGLNSMDVGVVLQPGRSILIPLPSLEAQNRTSSAKLTQHDGSATSESDVAATDIDDPWENVQGVLFRKRNAARSRELNQKKLNETGNSRADAEAKPLAKVVDLTEAARSEVAKPVWIYLVGGARVEADSANEMNEGVWYSRGNLSIFIEHSRIERIERERAPSPLDSSGSWTERGWSTGSFKIDALIKDNGARFGVDPYLIFCIMEQESQFKPRVVSPKGARGLMQLMPGTARHFGVRRPFDPAENIMGGTRYLKQLLQNFGGRVDLVLAGYNAGEGAVLKFGRNVPPYRETRNYVQRISKRYGQNKSLVVPVAGQASTAPGLR